MAKEDNSKDYITVVPRKKGVVSEFFNHMLAYGGFSFDNGVMRVWGDPSLFVPAKALVHCYHFLEEELGTQDAADIFYWIGRLYGKNSTLMLIQKFGFDKKKLPDFVNGATQDGFGYLEIADMKYNKDSVQASLKGNNSNLSLMYKELYGKKKKGVDYYMCGILSGGAEPLFEMPLECEEKNCCVKDDYCIYHLTSVKKYTSPAFFKKLDFKEDFVSERTRSLALKRKINFRFFQVKDLKFGDGSFVLRGYKGFNMAVYEHIVLDKIMLNLLGAKKFSFLKNKMAEIFIDETFNLSIKTSNFNSQAVIRLLEHIKMFGLGDLKIYRSTKDSIIIQNMNNPYSIDVKNIFGKLDNSSVDLLMKLFVYSFKKYFDKKVKCEIMKNALSESYFKIIL